MTRSEFYNRIYKKIANKNLSTLKACQKVVSEIESQIIEGLVEDKEVIFSSFKLQQKRIKGRKGVFMGIPYETQDTISVKIKPLKKMLSELNK